MTATHNLRDMLHGSGQMLLNALFPPRCPTCHTQVTAAGNFCPACFSKLHQIASPFCACCGIPFVVAAEEDSRCPTCLDAPPEFSQARAALVYDETSAPLISALKFNDQWANLARYVGWMHHAGGDVLTGADVLVPVPLHWRRMLTRKFNQSALLAYGLQRVSGVPCAPDILKRSRYTRPQMRLKRKERLKNVSHAFAVPARIDLAHKTIVLVDDVITTGATANACAKALKRAGAREVRVLALARTVRD